MPHITIDVSGNFLRQIDLLERHSPELCEDILESGAEIVEAQVRSNLRGVIGKNLIAPQRSTGTLVHALGTSPAKQNKRGHYDIRVGFNEKGRPSGRQPNGKIANVLEYGRRDDNYGAKPFLKPAVARTQEQAVDAMQRKLDEYVRSIT